MRAIGQAALFVAVLSASSVGAAPVTLHYTSSWAGLPAGDIDLQLDDQPNAYRSRIDIRTSGLPRWFTRFHARAVSEGGLSLLGLAAPDRYDAVYDLRSRKGKRISLRFPGSGDDTVAERGAEDGSDSPPIAVGHRRGAIDPLAALMRMREAIRTGLAQRGGLSIPVYDGKRRFDVDERSFAAESRWIGGESRRVLHLELVLRPIAGFTGNDVEGNPDASPRHLDVLFSDDDSLVPLRVEVTVALLSAVVEYAGRCDGATPPCKAAFD